MLSIMLLITYLTTFLLVASNLNVYPNYNESWCSVYYYTSCWHQEDWLRVWVNEGWTVACSLYGWKRGHFSFAWTGGAFASLQSAVRARLVLHVSLRRVYLHFTRDYKTLNSSNCEIKHCFSTDGQKKSGIKLEGNGLRRKQGGGRSLACWPET